MVKIRERGLPTRYRQREKNDGMRVPEISHEVIASDGKNETRAAISRIFEAAVAIDSPVHVDIENVGITLSNGTQHENVHLFPNRAAAEEWMNRKDERGNLARPPGSFTVLAFWPE